MGPINKSNSLELPWDPLWEYVLGDASVAGSRAQNREPAQGLGSADSRSRAAATAATTATDEQKKQESGMFDYLFATQDLSRDEFSDLGQTPKSHLERLGSLRSGSEDEISNSDILADPPPGAFAFNPSFENQSLLPTQTMERAVRRRKGPLGSTKERPRDRPQMPPSLSHGPVRRKVLHQSPTAKAEGTHHKVNFSPQVVEYSFDDGEFTESNEPKIFSKKEGRFRSLRLGSPDAAPPKPMPGNTNRLGLANKAGPKTPANYQKELEEGLERVLAEGGALDGDDDSALDQSWRKSASEHAARTEPSAPSNSIAAAFGFGSFLNNWNYFEPSEASSFESTSAGGSTQASSVNSFISEDMYTLNTEDDRSSYTDYSSSVTSHGRDARSHGASTKASGKTSIMTGPVYDGFSSLASTTGNSRLSEIRSRIAAKSQSSNDADADVVRIKFKSTQNDALRMLPPIEETQGVDSRDEWDNGDSRDDVGFSNSAYGILPEVQDERKGTEHQEDFTQFDTFRESRIGSIHSNEKGSKGSNPPSPFAANRTEADSVDHTYNGHSLTLDSTEGRGVSPLTIDERFKTPSPSPRPVTPPLRQMPLGRKLACCSVKNLSEGHQLLTMKSGIPFQDLSKEQLAEIFPKVRGVSDDQKARAAEAFARSRSFEGSYPTQSQTSVGTSQPPPLLEYDYESNFQLFVCYSKFGPSARELLEIRAAKKPKEYDRSVASLSKAIIQVEASTISTTDCVIRRGGWWGPDFVPLPNIPGVDMIGKIYRIDHEASKKYQIRKGDRVLSLTKWGGNARFIALDPSLLIKVPEYIDPARTVCLVETYLAAFQVLHNGQLGAIRYRKNALKGKSLFIIGSVVSGLGRAFAQLAQSAGASKIYAPAKPKQFEQLEKMGLTPLNKDDIGWIEQLQSSMDMVISYEEKVSGAYYDLLKRSGEVVVLRNRGKDVQELDLATRNRPQLICKRSLAQNRSRTVVYDVYSEWDDNLDRCKKDLEHLLLLLHHGSIAPRVLDRVPLSKVARAQEIMESKRLSGFLVCEPWLVSKSRAVRL